MSDINRKLHFSPKYTFENIETALENGDKECLIKAFKDRICGFYLKPAEELNHLNKDEYAFAVGVLCVSTIDCLACVTTSCTQGDGRFKKWVKNNIEEFSPNTLADRFYDDFRNGLVHEGRIKKGGQFLNRSHKLVDNSEGKLSVDSERLLHKINDLFETYITNIDNDEFDKLDGYLKNLIRN